MVNINISIHQLLPTMPYGGIVNENQKRFWKPVMFFWRHKSLMRFDFCQKTRIHAFFYQKIWNLYFINSVSILLSIICQYFSSTTMVVLFNIIVTIYNRGIQKDFGYIQYIPSSVITYIGKKTRVFIFFSGNFVKFLKKNIKLFSYQMNALSTY